LQRGETTAEDAEDAEDAEARREEKDVGDDGILACYCLLAVR